MNATTSVPPVVPLQSTMIAAFENRFEAEKLFQLLEDRGVPSTLVDLSVQQPENAIPPDFAQYQIQVQESDEKAAEAIAYGTEEGLALLQPAVHCPECGSLRVLYPNIPRNFLVSAVMRVMVKMHVLDGQYLCMSCQHEWPPR